jgi:DNA polymerase III delta subunit
MKITVLFGEDTTASYKRFTTIIDVVKKRDWEICHIENQTGFVESFTATSLFESDKLYALADTSFLKPKDLVWLGENADKMDNNWLILVDGALPKKLKDVLPKSTKYEEFQLPKLLFVFLESLYPGNAKNAMKLLHNVLETDAVELVFSLIGTHMRDLYYQSPSMPPWKKGKLQRQAQKFSKEKLKKIIAELAKIDSAVKLSQVELLPSLDLLLITQLQ